MDERQRRLRFPRGTWPLGKRLNSCPAQRGTSDRNVVGKLVSNNSILWRPACAFDDFRPWYYPSLSVCFAVTHVHGNLVKSLLWAIDLRKLFFECVVLLAGHWWVRYFFHLDAKMKNFFWKQRNSRRWIALTSENIRLRCCRQCCGLTRFRQRCFAAQMVAEHVWLHQVAANFAIIGRVHSSKSALVSRLIAPVDTEV